MINKIYYLKKKPVKKRASQALWRSTVPADTIHQMRLSQTQFRIGNPEFQRLHISEVLNLNQEIRQSRHVMSSASKTVQNQYYSRCIEKKLALAGVAPWIGCWPANRGVTCSVPSRDTCLGCRPSALLGMWERELIDVPATHDGSLPSSLSKNK